MTYCRKSKCIFTDCVKHLSHAPNGVEVSVMDLDKDCPRASVCFEAEAAKSENPGRMTCGTACAIFNSIDSLDVEDEVKGQAVWIVTRMETHNSITKAAMLRVIRWLLGLAFELPKERILPDGSTLRGE